MINQQQSKKSGLILSWALYDLANQFFALNVVTLYFASWVTIEKNTPDIFYSISFGISTFFVAILGLIFAAISDLSQRRKPFLIYLTLLSVIFTISLGFTNSVFVALVLFAIANFGCQTAIIFYNALMVNIAPQGKIGLISGLGKMSGYCGAALAIILIKPLVLKGGYQAAFLPTGVLFLLFSLPCLIFIKDKSKKKIDMGLLFNKESIIGIFKNLKKTAFNTKDYPGLLNFLRASFFGLCVVNTLILFMGVYAVRAFGLNEIEKAHLIIFSILFAILGSILSGFLSDHIGYRRSVKAIFILWSASLIFGSLVRQKIFFWPVGAMVGATLGATWVVLRAMAVKLVPENKIGEVFGLYNLVGYCAGIVGPLFWGALLLYLSRFGADGYRITLFSLNIFLIFAFVFVERLPKQPKFKK